MEERPYTQFYARMLGTFSLSFGGREIPIDANPRSKYMQFLILLLKAGNEGINKKSLIDFLRGKEEDNARRMNNFRQQVHLLRRVLSGLDLPAGNYVVQKEGSFYFSADYQVETDTGRLDGIIRKIRDGTREGPERQKLLWDFCQNYTGEFLPMLSGEEWVTTESAYYQKWYFNCLNELCELLKQQGEYEKVLELCTAASQMHPYDEWQAKQIDCLMSMNRYQEARKVYQQATETFYGELGVNSLDRVMAKYRNVSGQMYYTANVLAGMKESLNEKELPQGAYGCSYPSFLDIYRIFVRLGERLKTETVLMVCTIKEPERDWQEDQKASECRMECRMEQFRQVLMSGIRKHDVYTRYSRNQFLVLLIGAKKQDGEAIAARLGKRWKEISGDGKTAIEFTVQKAEGPRRERHGDEEKTVIHYTYCRSGEFHLAGSGYLA